MSKSPGAAPPPRFPTAANISGHFRNSPEDEFPKEEESTTEGKQAVILKHAVDCQPGHHRNRPSWDVSEEGWAETYSCLLKADFASGALLSTRVFIHIIPTTTPQAGAITNPTAQVEVTETREGCQAQGWAVVGPPPVE